MELPSLFTLNKDDKRRYFLENILRLFTHHLDNSPEFAKMMGVINFNHENINCVEELPFIPVRLFKLFELSSVPQDQIFKTMTSSGTTGQSVSKIFLDKETALLQRKILGKIVSQFLGNSRAPMIIIDCESTVKNRNKFSARTAGINGFSIFASKRIFALNEDMTLDVKSVKQFLKENQSRTIFLYGFTFIVYQHFYKELLQLNQKLDFANSILIHGGGWKKLISKSVDNKTFKTNLRDACGLNRIHDYYGMVEQTGTIHMECEYGYLHSSEYSDIIIRSTKDFTVCKFGEEGVIQLLSLLPLSYPGQSILTEDKGIIVGEDDCKCGRLGKYFKITGRLKDAEIRGCSDTYGAEYGRN